jgi:ABC-type Na+ efflux pump permease subunit
VGLLRDRIERGHRHAKLIAAKLQDFDTGFSTMVSTLATYIVPLAIGAVVLVLLLGLLNMMRGGSPNTSQKLMRMRVLLQFVAIVVIMFTVWVMGR